MTSEQSGNTGDSSDCPPVTRAQYLEGQLAVARAKARMYEEWVRENHPDCPLLPENIVADVAAGNDHYSQDVLQQSDDLPS